MISALLYTIEPLKILCEDAFERWKLSLLRGMHRVEWWSAIGMISSSCCLIQVILSFFQVGCASFNSWLGPIRPYSLAMLSCTLASSWYIAFTRPWLQTSTASISAYALILSMSPEILAFGSATLSKMRRVEKRSIPHRFVAEVRFEKIGCISCLHTIRTIALRFDDIVRTKESIENGAVHTYLSCESEELAKETLEKFTQEALASGFPSTLRSLDRVAT